MKPERVGIAALVGLVVSAGCAGLVGISGDYTIADGGEGDARSVDAPSPDDTHLPPKDGVSDQPSFDTSGDHKVDSSPGCSPPKTLCGPTCVDLDTDLANCGHCGTSCTTTSPSTASCTGGFCVVELIPGVVSTSIALGTNDVYLAAGLSNAILSVPKIGGTPSTLTSQSLPVPITTDGVNLYWGDIGGSPGVYSCPIAGCTPKSLSTDQVAGVALATGGGLVYWVGDNGDLYSCNTVGCASTPKDTGSSSATSRSIVTYGGSVYWASPGGTTSPTGIFSKPIGGGTLQTIATSPAECLAVDSVGNLYWVTSAGEVMKCTAAACAPTSLVPGTYKSTLYYPIATDGTSLYWSDLASIYKCSVSGCTTPTVLVTEPTYDIAVDGTSVYAANGTDGLSRITPK
jgi:hypothetical protein